MTNASTRTWAEHAQDFPTTGRWPVYVAPDTTRWKGDSGGYWRDRPLDRGVRGVFGLDHPDQWSIAEDTYCFECGNTHDRSGELSMPSEADNFEVIGEIPIDRWGDEELTLVDAARPCDSLLNLAWPGILNIGWTPAEASLVLRSWEDRFGAVPLSVSDSTLALVVARPPLTPEEARQVAEEHFHFCRYDSQFHGLEGISPYVRKILGARIWNFWWD